MTKQLLIGLFLVVFAGLSAAPAGAITFRTETFGLQGAGSFMQSPPIFSGNILSGTLFPGTFWFKFDDTGWPVDNPGTPQNERLEYVLAHYFHYDATVGGESWDGYFPPTGSGEAQVKWRFYAAAGDTIGGTCPQVSITIRDYNANGIMEDDEYGSKVVSGNIVAYINYSGGCFSSFCGNGSFSGTLNVQNWGTMTEEWYVPSATSASGRLYLRDGNCTVGTEESSWGQIKAIYR